LAEEDPWSVMMRKQKDETDMVTATDKGEETLDRNRLQRVEL
jgi:hypothetical protein